MVRIVMTPQRWRGILEIAIEVLRAIRNHLQGKKRG
jgi:hypothetical protein